jgi:uncharacterized protein YjeT (DUF2065 family)
MNGEMKRTRRSLFYLAGYLFPTGLGLLLAPQWFMKLLFANHEYSDAFPQFSGALLIGLGIVVVNVIRYGSPLFYRMTLLVRIPIWLCTLAIYLQSGETFFLAVLGVLGLGIVITGSTYLYERNR